MSAGVVRERQAMIAGMKPELVTGRFVFRSYPDAPPPRVLAKAIGSFLEAEGLSLILPADADSGQPEAPALIMRQITLNVFSALEGVGLTAAVAVGLADAGIACNMVAAFHHDHVFVPEAQAEAALKVLRELSQKAMEGDA